MSYIVLARKWRPKRFAEMVGQEHVLRALANALDSGKVHHAFLFTGTRGVGKTTIARILAKSLNCETAGVSSNPCGVCAACREIDEGRFVDLIEVDAASRTKVDDTRDLLDNVQYSPSRGRYKVYLIDEVHMLSNHSFNALLKTLEEPPPHVKFLLATTDPQKLPVTVLSRCLQFSLKRLPASLIGDRLKFIAAAENLQFDPAAAALLARAAEGSMRDALSLMDQLIAFGGGTLNEVNTRAMLGTIDRGHVGRLIDALARSDGPGLLAEVKDLDRDALSRKVREEVSPTSSQWGFALGSTYIRKVAFRDKGMIAEIQRKVVNRLRQVTAAMKQAGDNAVAIIHSEADKQAAQRLGRAQAVRPEVVGRALAEIQRQPAVAQALFRLLDISATMKTPGKIILTDTDSAGLILNN